LFRLAALCLLAIVNWAAFVVPETRCQAMFSFLSLERFDRFPSAETCRMNLVIIVATLDFIIVAPMLGLSGRRGRH